MSQIKKHTWKGLVVVAAMLLSVGLLTQTAFAATTVTTLANATVPSANAAAAPGTNVFTPFNSNLALTGSVATDFPLAGTITVTPPAGYQFNTAAVVTATSAVTGTCTTAPTFTVVVALGSITATNTAAAAGTGCVVTFNLSAVNVIQATTINSIAGNLQVQSSSGLALTNAGVVTPGALCATSCITITSSIPTVASDGTTSSTLTFFPKSSTGAGLTNTVVTATTSRGTLSVSSNTTTTTTCTTSVGTSCTLTFRGNGTTGSANITATTAAPNPGSGSINVEVVSTNSSPTLIKFLTATSSGHVAANTTSVYTTPTLASRVRFQVTNSNGDGVDGQLIQATVDKGYIVIGDTAPPTVAGPGSCAGTNVADSMNSATVQIDGTNTSGVATFTVCARTGQVGPLKVTAKNLSTTMTDATATLTAAGVPNKIETTVTGGAITATIKDKDGNEAADGTTVTAVAPAFSGAVSPTCGTTSNGKVSFSAAASGASVQVILTVFVNDSGTGAAGTCLALGSVAAASATVNVGAGGTPGPSTGAGFTGTAPGRGSIGLLVTAGSTNAASLVAALAAAGCTVESLAVLEGGVWKIYINGAPVVVNAAFPGTLGATVAFFVRCAA